MLICLPKSKRFPDTKGTVYVAGWGHGSESRGNESACTTGQYGPDPYSKCKFPYVYGELEFHGCLKTSSPSSRNSKCMKLYEKMKGKKILDKGYGRVSSLDLVHCNII